MHVSQIVMLILVVVVLLAASYLIYTTVLNPAKGLAGELAFNDACLFWKSKSCDGNEIVVEGKKIDMREVCATRQGINDPANANMTLCRIQCCGNQ